MYPFLKAADKRASCITVHSYPLAVQPNQPTPTPEQALAVTTDTFFAKWSKIYNTLSEPKTRLILGETQSVTDGGASQVSNTFVSTLWSLDHMATSAWSGFSGAQFHGGLVTSAHPFNKDVGDYYTYSVIEVNAMNTNLVDVRPVYYGLLAFNRMLDWVSGFNGNMDITVEKASLTGKAENGFRSWLFSASNGNGALLMINKDSKPRAATFAVPKNIKDSGIALGEALTAPSVTSFSGITIAGQTLDSTCDGRLAGKYNPKKIHISKTGTYTATLPAYSAMVLYLGKDNVKLTSRRAGTTVPNTCH